MFRGFGIGQEFPVQEDTHRYDLKYPSSQAHEALFGGYDSHLPARRRAGQAGRGLSPGLRPHAHLPSPVCTGHRQPGLDRADGGGHRRSSLRIRPGPAGPRQSSAGSLDHPAHPSPSCWTPWGKTSPRAASACGPSSGESPNRAPISSPVGFPANGAPTTPAISPGATPGVYRRPSSMTASARPPAFSPRSPSWAPISRSST